MGKIGCTTAFLLLLLLVSLVAATHDTHVCPNVQTSLTTLADAFNTLCNKMTQLTPCSCPVEWQSLPMIQIGAIDLRSTSTQSFFIPLAVPSTAREVLVYVYVIMGYSRIIFLR